MNLPLQLRSRRRLEMRLTREGVPEVPLLGRYNNLRAEIGLPDHTHGDILEICYLVKGRQTYRVRDRDYHLRGGDVFVAFPHEFHSSAGRPQEKGVLYWMMVHRSRPAFFGLSPAQGRLLWRSLCHLPSRHFPGSPRLKEHLDSLTALFHAPRLPLRPTLLATEALGLLLEVLHCSARPAAASPALRLRQLQTYIDQHLEDALSVPHLAAQAGLSTARFKAWFKEATGIPPAEYVLRRKIDEARRLLLTGRSSVTEIAHRLDFSSSQYFATVFKRFTGASPSTLLSRS